MSLIEIRDLHKRFGAVEVLKGIDLDIAAGEVVAIIGKSGGIAKIYQLIQKVAASNTNVLISGESGTGKELLARALHTHLAGHDGRAGDRPDVPPVAVDHPVAVGQPLQRRVQRVHRSRKAAHDAAPVGRRTSLPPRLGDCSLHVVTVAAKRVRLMLSARRERDVALALQVREKLF